MTPRTALIGAGAVALLSVTMTLSVLGYGTVVTLGAFVTCGVLLLFYRSWQHDAARINEATRRFAAGLDAISEALTRRSTSVDANGRRFSHHSAEVCAGQVCPLHSPSDHHMASWPLVFRADRPPLIDRLCDHGTAHPDPDALAYLRKFDPSDNGAWSKHQCCGCCEPEPDEPEIGDVLAVPPSPEEPELGADTPTTDIPPHSP
jgi:hypothetical protein